MIKTWGEYFMKRIFKHPLDITADIFKRAFLENGFQLSDDGEAPELLPREKSAEPFLVPGDFRAEPILLEHGNTLRTEQLTAHLAKMRGPLPVKKIVCGVIYDKRDGQLPARLRLEGVLADRGVAFRDYQKLWDRIAVCAYGIGASCRIEAAGAGSYELKIEREGREAVRIGCTGPGSWLTRTLLDGDEDQTAVWVFRIDLDTAAMDLFAIPDRQTLYSGRLAELQRQEDSSCRAGESYANRLEDLLRRMGYARFHGMRLYPADIYKKMNMIQEAWDTNNRGVQLEEELNGNTGLPTVLTPALEQALSECWAAGEKSGKIFDIAHIFLPDAKGGAPTEKLALTLGAYGPDITSASFKAEVGEILNQAGFRNHFFFPTNLAIAYDTSDTWLILDEKMRYMEGNFGGVSAIAERNYGIGTHCFMANLEIGPLEQKDREEYAFTPPELR